MLELQKKHYGFAGEHDFIENDALMVTMDELAEMITDWEGYMDQYPDSPEISNIEYTQDYYFRVYIGAIQIANSGLYEDMGVDADGAPLLKLAEEPLRSYERFIEYYPDSELHGVVQGLYDAYKTDNFMYSEAVPEYLESQGYAVLE